MITTKGQKFIMLLIGIVSMLLAVATILPFKTVFEHEKIFNIEIVVKLIVIPVLILLLSIYPNMYKYRQVIGYREQSKVVSVMSYFPGVSYIVGLIVNALYVLTKGVEPLGMTSWCLWFIVFVVALVAICCLFHVFTRFEMLLGVTEHAILDISLFIIGVCFAVMSFQITKAYHNTMLQEGRIGGIYFTIIAIATLIGFGLHIRNLINLVSDDEVNISIKMADLDATSFVAKTAEYNRAYNDILDDFEGYFGEQGDLDVLVEEVEEDSGEVEEDYEAANTEESAEEVELEVVDESLEAEGEDPAEEAENLEETPEAEGPIASSVTATTDEALETPEIIEEGEFFEDEVVEIIRESVKEVVSVEYVDEEVIAELTEEQQSLIAAKKQEIEEKRALIEQEALALEASEAELASLREGIAPKQEEPVKEAAPKVEKEPKSFEPSFRTLTNIAMGIPGATIVQNEQKTSTKCMVDRKPFLLMTDTPNNYRLVFFADLDKLANWMIAEPSIVKAKSPKGDNWFKVVNKGQMKEELLEDIILSSQKALLKFNEEEKARRAAARLAAKLEAMTPEQRAQWEAREAKKAEKARKAAELAQAEAEETKKEEE